MPDELPDLIGGAPTFLDLLAHVSAAAPLDRPLLVVGERGTGKELIAARLHFLSRRWDQPFIKLNCAALSDDLLESELFGHEAGAFTGATRRHQGRFERADRGTLFLDEIASASLRVQEKVLRVIEYGEFERLGGGTTLRCDVRVIGATNVDLPSRAKAGQFRADLLDRLAFDVITVPPLRARSGDIARLAEHFGAGMARELGTGFAGFAPAALAVLAGYDWPGNIRELKNTVERSVYRHVAAGKPAAAPIDEIALDPFASPHRPAVGRPPAASPSDALGPAAASPTEGAYDFKARIAAIERQLLVAALQANAHHQRQTAAYLGLSYDQFRGLLRKFRLTAKPPASPDHSDRASMGAPVRAESAIGS